MRIAIGKPGFWAGFFLAALPLLAQEGGGGGHESNTLIWQWANFAILAGLLGWIIVKQGGPVLAARTKQIQEGLAAGEKAKAEADARAASVQQRLANLESEIAALRASAKEERDREAERIGREGEAEIARVHRQAELEIEAAGKQAHLDVRRFAARLAIELAEQKIRERMTPEIQSGLLHSFAAGLSAKQMAQIQVKK
jgi:F-type H+-transporting ATPase subunit b